MWVVGLSGGIMRVYSTEGIKFLESLGYLVASSYIGALNYPGCPMGRGKDPGLYRYAGYF